ncbi:hypothetical protein DBR42_11900 [Pelomonas sp. HMWF004]|nr:hypothetical protein DBR42_11900 [Pelomonas sp. HMWF004]
MAARWSPAEAAQMGQMLTESSDGSPNTVRAGLAATGERTQADEFIVACAVHEHGLRRRYELLAEIGKSAAPTGDRPTHAEC